MTIFDIIIIIVGLLISAFGLFILCFSYISIYRYKKGLPQLKRFSFISVEHKKADALESSIEDKHVLKLSTAMFYSSINQSFDLKTEKRRNTTKTLADVMWRKGIEDYKKDLKASYESVCTDSTVPNCSMCS